MPACVELQDAFLAGTRWFGWGPEKGSPLTARVHTCANHGVVVLGSADDLSLWLQRNAAASLACWRSVMDAGLAADQRIWTASFAAHRYAERALALRAAGPRLWPEALECAAMAAEIGRSLLREFDVRPGYTFDPWGPFERAMQQSIRRAVQSRP